MPRQERQHAAADILIAPPFHINKAFYGGIFFASSPPMINRYEY
jgi:hypothetical protein